jgi:hypothetical protein
VFVVVVVVAAAAYFIFKSVWKLLDIPSYTLLCAIFSGTSSSSVSLFPKILGANAQ